jgi:predicted 2-oxoglutarate/Fe(II)-dependent dioxygenase YbiX
VDPAVLARFGLFVADDVVDAETCERLRVEMEMSRAEAATVMEEGRDYVDAEQRSTKYAKVSDETRRATEEQLRTLKRRLEEHFDVELGELQPPQFLVYESGDFFGVHRDSSAEEDAADYAKARKLSVVLFVNDGYSGGRLELYGLVEGQPAMGIPLDSRPGLVVAFPSGTPHGVTKVTQGERYTVVTWFA